jgi:hypothetical protein
VISLISPHLLLCLRRGRILFDETVRFLSLYHFVAEDFDFCQMLEDLRELCFRGRRPHLRSHHRLVAADAMVSSVIAAAAAESKISVLCAANSGSLKGSQRLRVIAMAALRAASRRRQPQGPR